MSAFKNNKGITIYSLIITVVMLGLIAGTATYTAIDVYQDAKEEAISQELQIIQNAVNNEISKMKNQLSTSKDEDGDEKIDYIYEWTWEKGQDLPENLSDEVKNIIGFGNGYRYYTNEDLKEIGISNIKTPVLINFITGDIVLEKGINNKFQIEDFEDTFKVRDTTIVIQYLDNVPIPNGFVYLTGKRDTGLVIKNIIDGNEFVWIPVENELTEEMEVVDVDAENGITKDMLQKEYKDMSKSVKEYGGFYVGRYETSWNEVTKKVESQSNKNPISGWTVLGEEWEDINVTTNGKHATWYGLYKKQKELYNKDSDSVKSGMIYVSQWNEIIKFLSDVKNTNVAGDINFIDNCTGMGNFSGTKINTGSNIAYCTKNIFDLAGNSMEWTQTRSNANYRMAYGGYYNTTTTDFKELRAGTEPEAKNQAYGSRLQLYLKIN